MKKALILAGFPGIGKTSVFNSSINLQKTILDSDSSKFDKSEFLLNYINHIKENLYLFDIILVSTHDQVLKSLIEHQIDFYVVYPDKSLKSEYLERYKNRGSSKEFINLIESNWDIWITELENSTDFKKIKLYDNEFLMDIIKE